MKYKVGDKVCIVNERTHYMDSFWEMGEWLGKTMTISSLCPPLGYHMKEDNNRFIWREEEIVEKIEKEENHSPEYYLFKYFSMKLSEKEAQLNAQLSEIKKIQKEIKEVLDNES